MNLEKMIAGVGLGLALATSVAGRVLPMYMSGELQSLPEQTTSCYTMDHPTKGYRIEVLSSGRTFAYRRVEE